MEGARMVRTLVAVGLMMAAGLVSGLEPPAARAQAPQTFTLVPGGQAQVNFEAYCLDFGREFPTSLQAPNAVAPDTIPGALAYARDNNLTDTMEEAVSLQHAIWRLSNVPGSPQGDDLTQQIIDAAQPAPAQPQDATSLIDAASANQVRLTAASWQPLGEQIEIGNLTAHYRGSGQLTVENISQQPLTLYMPIGTVFPSPSEAVQNMTGYSTSVNVQNPSTPTPVPSPVAQVPQQLPETAGGSASGPGGLLVAGAIALLAFGGALRLASLRHRRGR